MGWNGVYLAFTDVAGDSDEPIFSFDLVNGFSKLGELSRFNRIGADGASYVAPRGYHAEF